MVYYWRYRIFLFDEVAHAWILLVVDDSSLPWIIPNFLIHNGSAAGFMLRCWYNYGFSNYVTNYFKEYTVD